MSLLLTVTDFLKVILFAPPVFPSSSSLSPLSWGITIESRLLLVLYNAATSRQKQSYCSSYFKTTSIFRSNYPSLYLESWWLIWNGNSFFIYFLFYQNEAEGDWDILWWVFPCKCDLISQWHIGPCTHIVQPSPTYWIRTWG